MIWILKCIICWSRISQIYKIWFHILTALYNLIDNMNQLQCEGNVYSGKGTSLSLTIMVNRCRTGFRLASKSLETEIYILLWTWKTMKSKSMPEAPPERTWFWLITFHFYLESTFQFLCFLTFVFYIKWQCVYRLPLIISILFY